LFTCKPGVYKKYLTWILNTYSCLGAYALPVLNGKKGLDEVQEKLLYDEMFNFASYHVTGIWEFRKDLF
jgi:hypothetical protein